MKLKVLLVDDHVLVRNGVRSLLSQNPDVEKIKEASNGQEAIRLASSFEPDVVIMDYEMPVLNGVCATREIMRLQPNMKILMVSAYFSQHHVMEGIQAGIRGFLPKETKVGELGRAIKAIANGKTWFKGTVAELMALSMIDVLKIKQPAKQNSGLTKREKEIISLLADGLSPVAIGEKLSISKRTVDVHKANIFKKLKIRSVTELIRYAVRQGLVKL